MGRQTGKTVYARSIRAPLTEVNMESTILVMKRMQTKVYDSDGRWNSYREPDWFRCCATYTTSLVTYGSFGVAL